MNPQEPVDTLNFNQTLAQILREYDEAYLAESPYINPLHRFVERLRGVLGAETVLVYSLSASGTKFRPRAGLGWGQSRAIAFSKLEDNFLFEEQLTAKFLPASLASELFRHLPSNSSPQTIIISSQIQNVPFFMLFQIATSIQEKALRVLCLVAVRETLHIFRSTQMRRNLRCLEDFSRISIEDKTRREILHEICDCLQKRFDVPGASILELVETRDDELVFEKTYRHHQRTSKDNFTTDHGYAYHCATTRKALLITETFDNASPPIGVGLEFTSNDISRGKGKDVRVHYIRAPKTVEDEKSLMAYPLIRSGRVIGNVKVGSFDSVDAFDLHDLRNLEVLAPALSSLISNLEETELLKEKLETYETQKEMHDYAETLFFYREIALGLFHQVGNKLNRAASDLLVAESLAEDIQANDPDIKTYISDSHSTVLSGQELIVKAQKRGRSLLPIEEICLLNARVVRPAVDYAKKITKEGNIKVRHSLTTEDYSVLLDPQLVRESLINVINNAIWAIKRNKSVGSRELFVAVRAIHGNDDVKIEITDTGIGIAKETFPKLFSPFFTTRPKGEGTGLGLYFARRLLESFKGTIRITRSLPGVGTTVTVTLPLLGRTKK